MKLIISINNEASSFFTYYINQQILASITGQRETSTSRFIALKVVSSEVLVPLVAGVVCTGAMYRLTQATISPINHRLLLYYLGVALAGTLPLLISAKQRRLYVFPALPFYALAMAIIFNNVAVTFERYVNHSKRVFKYSIVISSILLVISIFLLFF